MRRILGMTLAAALLSWAAEGWGAQYPGWGDTGWVYASKRDCCNAAIAIAQEYSAEACINSGGVPRLKSGVQRGTCDWQWMQDAEGNILHRCSGEAAVWCR